MIVSADDKVIGQAMGDARMQLETMLDGNVASVGAMTKLADTILGYVNKGQVDISAFGLQALEKARQQLQEAQDQGTYLLKITDETVGDAMSMAQQVARDQTQAQRDALQILSETKTGDFADLTRYLTAAVMVFTLSAIYILQKRG
ncbi:MAG: hypothetical protein HZT43_10805 [Exiguobacterium profundum]|nr:MAG: hypothetical protein HZT43_10805 [Exiguobacterium profundum]